MKWLPDDHESREELLFYANVIVISVCGFVLSLIALAGFIITLR